MSDSIVMFGEWFPSPFVLGFAGPVELVRVVGPVGIQASRPTSVQTLASPCCIFATKGRVDFFGLELCV